MKPLSQEIVPALQASYAAHLTAIEAYTSQARHFSRWGYTKLANRAASNSTEEQEHANKLLSRLEALDSAPVFAHASPVYPQRDLVGILAANLSLEESAAQIERAGVTKARSVGDEVTATLFADNLQDTEAGIVEIEAMQGQIADIGLAQFLSTQI